MKDSEKLIELSKQFGSFKEIGKHLGLKWDSREYMNLKSLYYKLKRRGKLVLVNSHEPTPKTIEERVSIDINKSQESAKVREYKDKYSYVLKKLEESEKRFDALIGVKEPVDLVHIEPIVSQSKSEACPVIMLSDWHFEERIDPLTINGLNEYNLDIAAHRWNKCIQNSGKLIHKERHSSDIKQVIIWLGGDFITGYIHEELEESNYLSPTQAVRFAKERIISALKFYEQYGRFERIVVVCNFGNHGRCHDSETELLTKNGWKKYYEISVGDIVATYNMKSGKNEWQPLLDVYADFYDGKIIQAKNACIDWVVTPGHRMVVSNYKAKNSFKTMGDIIDNNRVGSFPKSAAGKDIDYDKISDDELSLLGWIMTDGHYLKSTHTVFITQSKIEGIEKIENILKKLNYSYGKDYRERDVNEICGKKSNCIKESVTFRLHMAESNKIKELLPLRKEIPMWMYELSERQVNILLQSIIDGDGTRRKGKKSDVAIYGLESFLSGLQALLLVNGIPCSVRKDNRGHSVLRLRIKQKGDYINVRKNSKYVDYKGIIWCGTVENGTLITRRNGVPLISGNTNKKPRVSTGYKNSYEWMMYKDIEDYFDGNKKFQFVVPNGLFAYVDIYGFMNRFWHGDTIQYGGGIGGLTVPLIKAIGRYNSTIKCDFNFMGHYHQLFEATKDCMVNGSGIGYSAYAQRIGASFERPQQGFKVIDQKHGYTTKLQIFCE